MPVLTFGTLICLDTQDGAFGSDELSLRVDGNEVWQSGDIDAGDSVDLAAVGPLNIGSGSLVTLVEKDVIGDDLIGEFNPNIAPIPVQLNQASASYELSFTVV